MSAPRYRIPAKARALLKERDVTMAKLAEQSGISQARVLRAMTGHPDGTMDDRSTLTSYLFSEECAALGWDDFGHLLPVEQSNPAAAHQ